jgi:hypothetical protein
MGSLDLESPFASAVIAAGLRHFRSEPPMTPPAFKRSIRDLQVWCSSCMVAFSDSDPIGVLIGAKRPSGTLVHKIAASPSPPRANRGLPALPRQNLGGGGPDGGDSFAPHLHQGRWSPPEAIALSTPRARHEGVPVPEGPPANHCLRRSVSAPWASIDSTQRGRGPTRRHLDRT